MKNLIKLIILLLLFVNCNSEKVVVEIPREYLKVKQKVKPYVHPNIKLVKESTLIFVNNNILIGDAFNAYSYIENIRWSAFQSKQKEDLIMVDGEIKFDKLIAEAKKQPFNYNEETIQAYEKIKNDNEKYYFVVTFSKNKLYDYFDVKYVGVSRIVDGESDAIKFFDDFRDMAIDEIYNDTSYAIFTVLGGYYSKIIEKEASIHQ